MIARSERVGVVAATAAGRAMAARIAAALPGRVLVLDEPTAADGLRRAWGSCSSVVPVPSSASSRR
jgi:cobalt-precorrin 5A hydrolase / precorrin-3B C17-methyltransferase